MRRTVFSNNNSSSGGGLACNYSSPEIRNCYFKGNSAKWGGALAITYSSAIIANSRFTDNVATQFAGGGGALNVSYWADAQINNCIISNNHAQDGNGGGILIDRSSTTTINSVISNNIADHYGGGIFVTGECSPTPIINYCTIADNSSGLEGGGITLSNTILEMHNSIIWNNTSASGSQVSLKRSPCSLDIYTTNVAGCLLDIFQETGTTVNWDPNNFCVNPDFVDADSGDYHLQKNSPCINVGSVIELPYDDMDFEIRPQSGIPDIGADEYNFSDFDEDRDVDGTDLGNYIIDISSIELSDFAMNFGQVD